MFRRSEAVAVMIVVASLAIPASAWSTPAAVKKLKGTVGPGFTIVLKKGRKKVKTLKAGTYRFVISDKSSSHDFTLEKEKGSRKFERRLTGVSFAGKKTMKVKLTKGKYKYFCSVHEPSMFGFFKVK